MEGFKGKKKYQVRRVIKRSVDKPKPFTKSHSPFQNLKEDAAGTHISGDSHNYHQAMTHHSMLEFLLTKYVQKVH